jgi:hypothetical protein
VITKTQRAVIEAMAFGLVCVAIAGLAIAVVVVLTVPVRGAFTRSVRTITKGVEWRINFESEVRR